MIPVSYNKKDKYLSVFINVVSFVNIFQWDFRVFFFSSKKNFSVIFSVKIRCLQIRPSVFEGTTVRANVSEGTQICTRVFGCAIVCVSVFGPVGTHRCF